MEREDWDRRYQPLPGDRAGVLQDVRDYRPEPAAYDLVLLYTSEAIDTLVLATRD